MANATAISWCDHTKSPWEGCTKVSPGCDHCYAATRNGRFSKGANWGPGAPRRRTQDWSDWYRWNREAKAAGVRRRCFASLCDPFDNEVDPQWRYEFFAMIALTPHLDHLLLTKRIGNAAAMIAESVAAVREQLPDVPAWPWRNVWLGATVCNRDEYRRDAHKLRDIVAYVRFLSMEPLLGPIHGVIGLGAFDWVIVGSESGPKARPVHLEWVRGIVQQCRANAVPVHVKQLGHVVWDNGAGSPGQPWPEHVTRREIRREGCPPFELELVLKHPKGGDPSEWPQDLRVQEFPCGF